MGGKTSTLQPGTKDFQQVVPFGTQDYDNLQQAPKRSSKKLKNTNKTAPSPADIEITHERKEKGRLGQQTAAAEALVAGITRGGEQNTHPTSPILSSDRIETVQVDNGDSGVTNNSNKNDSNLRNSNENSLSRKESTALAEGAVQLGSPTEFNFDQTEGQIRRERLADSEFECSQITNFLFVAGVHVATNWDAIKDNGITYIVNCSSGVIPCKFIDDPHMHYLALNMVDGRMDDVGWFVCKVMQFVLKARTQGARILIHCEKGVSRSCSFVISYVMFSTGCGFKKAFEIVKERRRVCAPNTAFTCNLIEIQDILSGDSQMSPLLFRCAYHLPHDAQTPVLKLCRFSDTRKFVPLKTSSLDPRGCYVLRVFDTDSTPLLFMWQGSQASGITAEVAVQLSKEFFGIYSKAETCQRVLNGQEAEKFFQFVHKDGDFDASKSAKFLYDDFYDMRPTTEEGTEKLRLDKLATQQQEHNRLAGLKPPTTKRESSITGFNTFSDDIIGSPDADSSITSPAPSLGGAWKQNSFSNNSSRSRRGSGAIPALDNINNNSNNSYNRSRRSSGAGIPALDISGSKVETTGTARSPAGGGLKLELTSINSPCGASSVASSTAPLSLPTLRDNAMDDILTDDDSTVNGASAPSSLSMSLSLSLNANQLNSAVRKSTSDSTAVTGTTTHAADSSVDDTSPIVDSSASDNRRSSRPSVPMLLPLNNMASDTSSRQGSISPTAAQHASTASAISTHNGRNIINKDDCDASNSSGSPALFLGLQSKGGSQRRSFKGMLNDVTSDVPAPMLKGNSFKGGALSRETSFKGGNTDGSDTGAGGGSLSGSGASSLPPLLGLSSKPQSFRDLFSNRSSRRNSAEPGQVPVLAALGQIDESKLELKSSSTQMNPMAIHESGEVTARSEDTSSRTNTARKSDQDSAPHSSSKPTGISSAAAAAAAVDAESNNQSGTQPTSRKLFDDPPPANRAEYMYDNHGEQIKFGSPSLKDSQKNSEGTLKTIATMLLNKAGVGGGETSSPIVAPNCEAAPLLQSVPRSRPLSRNTSNTGFTGPRTIVTTSGGKEDGHRPASNTRSPKYAAAAAASGSGTGSAAVGGSATKTLSSSGSKRRIQRQEVEAGEGGACLSTDDSEEEEEEGVGNRRALPRQRKQQRSPQSGSGSITTTPKAAALKLNVASIPPGSQTGGGGGGGGGGGILSSSSVMNTPISKLDTATERTFSASARGALAAGDSTHHLPLHKSPPISSDPIGKGQSLVAAGGGTITASLNKPPSLSRIPVKSPSPLLEKHPSNVMLSRGPTPIEDMNNNSSTNLLTSRQPSRTASRVDTTAPGSISPTSKNKPNLPPKSPAVKAGPAGVLKPTLYQAVPRDDDNSKFFWQALGVYDDDDLHEDSLLLLACPLPRPNFIWVGEEFDFGADLGGTYGDIKGTNGDSKKIIRKWAAAVEAGDVTDPNVIGQQGLSRLYCEVEISANESEEFWNAFNDGF